MSERISATVPTPVKEDIMRLMEKFDLSESAMAAKLIEAGIKVYDRGARK